MPNFNGGKAPVLQTEPWGFDFFGRRITLFGNSKQKPTTEFKSGGGGDPGGGGAGGSWTEDAKEVETPVDPVKLRMDSNGLTPGAEPVAPPETKVSVESSPNTPDISTDWRVRVSVATASKLLYNDSPTGILSPLKSTNGVIFPYTPNITLQHTATYSPQKFTHSNYSAFSYENSEVQAITITGEFTIQSVEEGLYLLASIYFFRAATKMFFGTGNNVGNPPPMVFLDGYGSHYFPHVPCVITQFQHVLPPDVDYIAVQVPGSLEYTRLPATSNISITLQPLYSKKIIASFNLQDFAAGKLIRGNGGFI